MLTENVRQSKLRLTVDPSNQKTKKTKAKNYEAKYTCPIPIKSV